MAGQPTLFDDHMVEGAREYLTTFDGDEEVSIPTRAGLSLHLGVSKSAIDRWEKTEEHPEGLVSSEIYSQFRKELNRLRAIAEDKLIKKGLTGDYNAAITKLMLTKHGYSDQQKKELTGAEGGPVKVDHTWTVKVVG